MDKHTKQYNWAVKFIEYGIDEKKACELAVEVEEMIDKGALEIGEKVYTFLEDRGVMMVKGDVKNG